jgi:Mitochondrial branched-chain alpha-ketoacid dehydrogenase kinase
MIKKFSSVTNKGWNNVWENSQGVIGEYSQRPVKIVSLNDLVKLQHDVTVCAMFAHRELPIRLARRVRAIERLPFIVGVNPFIKNVYDLYKDSFHTLINLPAPKETDQQLEFTEILADLTETHQTVIPNLAKGFKECGKYMSQESKQDFLDKFVSARIGIRVIAEHYLHLQKTRPSWIGVVNTKSSPYLLLDSICRYVQQLCDLNYGSSPEFEITGYTDTKFAYIDVHMEYIFMELVKNAMRATGIS